MAHGLQAFRAMTPDKDLDDFMERQQKRIRFTLAAFERRADDRERERRKLELQTGDDVWTGVDCEGVRTWRG
jgi:hypothetical protein